MDASNETSPIRPIISTTNGQVRGQLRKTVYGDNYYCFDGIPYAKPPLGELRFKSPQPAEPWQGVRDCIEVAPKCIQYNKYTDRVEGSEDCLYLNIYAKNLKSDSPWPVMVYIHGGGFTTGSASRLAWGPDYLMMKNIVVVTIGYRLGALGFLSLSDPKLQVPGNAGLKDIVMALKWLKQNYHNFNGDANNVTLVGHSSGSFAANLLIMSPQCEALFQRVVLMSSVSLRLREIPNLPFRFAKHIGYQGADDNQKILTYLRSLEPENLCDFNILTQNEKNHSVAYVFCPSKENASVPDAIITKDPFEILAEQDAWSNKIPLVVGATSLESLIRYPFFTSSPQLYATLKEHPEYLLSYEIVRKCDLATQQQLAQKLIKLHLGKKELNLENAMDVIDLISYDFMYHSLHCFLNARVRHAQAPTYLYRFDFDSPDFNFYRIKRCGRGVRGVGHVDDLGYIFYMPESFKLPRESAEYKTIVRMVDLITAFMDNSDPNSGKIKPTIWKPLKPQDARKCLNISNDVTFIDWPELVKCKVWDQYLRDAGLRVC